MSAEDMASAMSQFSEMGLSPTSGLPGEKGKKPAPKPEGDDTTDPAAPEPRGPGRPSTRAKKLEVITDATDRERLSRMSNEAFDKYYDLTLKLQNKELLTREQADAEFKAKQGEVTGSRYFDHEHGYTLTPEYHTLSGHADQITAEHDFWSEQLTSMREGQPVNWLERKADGTINVSAQSRDPATPGLEGALFSKIAQAANIRGDIQRQLGELPKQHAAQYNKFNEHVTKMDTELVGAVKGEGFTKAVATNLEQFPAILRGRPEIQLLAKLRVAGDALYNQNLKLQEQLSKTTNAAQALSSGAPSPVTTGGSAQTISNDSAAMRAQLKELNEIASGRSRASW